MKTKIETAKFLTQVITYGLVKVHPAIKRMDKLEAKGKHREEYDLAIKTVQDWSSYCVKVANWKITVNGLEKIPTDRPVLFIPNHQSYADIPVLLHALRDYPFGFVVRKTMANMPFIKQLFKHFKCVSIDASNVRQSASAINETCQNIKDGFSMAIFPEGRRTFANIPERFKNGAFKIAKKTGVTIVPIYLHNVHRVFEGNGHWLGHPENITVNILDTIDTKNMTRNDISSLNDRVYETILKCAQSFTN